jgi:hypothetical protein
MGKRKAKKKKKRKRKTNRADRHLDEFLAPDDPADRAALGKELAGKKGQVVAKFTATRAFVASFEEQGLDPRIATAADINAFLTFTRQQNPGIVIRAFAVSDVKSLITLPPKQRAALERPDTPSPPGSPRAPSPGSPPPARGKRARGAPKPKPKRRAPLRKSDVTLAPKRKAPDSVTTHGFRSIGGPPRKRQKTGEHTCKVKCITGPRGGVYLKRRGLKVYITP